MEKKVEFLRRIYDSLTGWVSDNPIVKKGNIMYVSTKDDGVFDVVLVADGKNTFLQLLNNYKNGIPAEGQMTDVEREKLKEALTKDDLGEIEKTIKGLVDLVDENTDGVINKFKEIVSFLSGIEDTNTLEGIVSGISSQISGLNTRINDVENKIPTTFSFDKMEKITNGGKSYTVKEILTALIPLLDETVVTVNSTSANSETNVNV